MKKQRDSRWLRWLLEVNGGDTNYHGLQVELKRRMSAGLLVQGSYVWSHSISNELSQGIGGSFTTLRNPGNDKAPSPFDIRQAVKVLDALTSQAPGSGPAHFHHGFEHFGDRFPYAF